MTFSKWLFRICGVYGLLAIIPQYFMESQLAEQSLPLTHPEYYYGFLGVGAAWQVAFLIIAKDPVRYRAIIVPGIIEKLSFAFALYILFFKGRVPTLLPILGSVDLVMAILFFISYSILGRVERTA